MKNNTYAKAYTEVLEIISYLSPEEYAKIPSEKIKYYEENKDKEYIFKIDPDIDLEEQNISRQANAIIVSLYRDYFATEEQKEKIEQILRENQNKLEEERREKYNPDDLFKNKNQEVVINKPNDNNLPIEVKKESFFTRFIKYIKSLFGKI